MKKRTLNFILILSLVLIVTSGCIVKTELQEPVTEEPVIEEPVTEEPVTEEPVTEEPVIEEPVLE